MRKIQVEYSVGATYFDAMEEGERQKTGSANVKVIFWHPASHGDGYNSVSHELTPEAAKLLHHDLGDALDDIDKINNAMKNRG